MNNDAANKDADKEAAKKEAAEKIAAERKRQWQQFFIGLARALGATHTAVGLTLVAPAVLPVALGLLAGLVGFFLTGRARSLEPTQQTALGYAGPVLAVLLVRITLSNPADADAIQRELLAFFGAVWGTTPVPAYLAAVLFGLARARPLPVPKNPFVPPGR